MTPRKLCSPAVTLCSSVQSDLSAPWLHTVARPQVLRGACYLTQIATRVLRGKAMAMSDSLTAEACLQGAATQVWACVAKDLESHSGSYLSNCHISKPSKAALDDDLANGLWQLTHEQLRAALKGHQQAALM